MNWFVKALLNTGAKVRKRETHPEWSEEEVYWRSQARGLGFEPDDWEKARDFRNEWFARNDEANAKRPPYVTVESQSDTGLTVRWSRKWTPELEAEIKAKGWRIVPKGE